MHKHPVPIDFEDFDGLTGAFNTAADVHPKIKNKKATKALYLLAYSLIGKFFSRDYP